MTRNVVTDAGPLMAFTKLNVFHLLKELYVHVYIPFAVYEETVIVGMRRGYADAFVLNHYLDRHQWVYDKNISVPQEIADLSLDQGEKHAIALALEKDALILMDEEQGRDAARNRNLKVKGTLGALIESYRKQLISEKQLRALFEVIVKRKDIWISGQLCSHLLIQLFGDGD